MSKKKAVEPEPEFPAITKEKRVYLLLGMLMGERVYDSEDWEALGYTDTYYRPGYGFDAREKAQQVLAEIIAGEAK